jgi:hypothetical protein
MAAVHGRAEGIIFFFIFFFFQAGGPMAMGGRLESSLPIAEGEEWERSDS